MYYKMKVSNTQNYDFDECRDVSFTLLDGDIVIGMARAIIIEPEDEEDMLYMSDCISNDFYESTTQMIDNDEIWFCYDCKYFYLDRIIINKKYRNNNIGSYFINRIKRYAKRKAEVMYFSVYPFELANSRDFKDTNTDSDKRKRIRKEIKRLEKFYSKNGFEIYKNNYKVLAMKDMEK